MLKIAICDDNIDELSHMVSLIEEYRALNHVDYEYTVFHNGFELMPVLEKGNSFDIYCLDIIMPSFTGIELAKEIRTFDKNAHIIFFTSSPEFALESYSVKAINYVLKPVTKDKLFFTLNDVLEHIDKVQDAAIVVKSNDGIQKILLSNLVYVEAMGKKVLYHLISGRAIECTEQFSVVCEKLIKEGSFFKPHRSYLVNMQHIDTIDNHQVTLQTLSSVPIAQGKSKDIKQQYLAYQMEGGVFE
ncbi:LytTR family DNA-binding domain-containing protein [Tissierella sp.]|uniref:LytR/AlgR family response regulator transcription factor n=1 Tax=Tissierella sp. TaxID=41274 RepID=UPI0028553C92|nr:LytTR family DNA-binding domain-containing protein [Tissierella sp.]MDR7855199.1 LytTR family DNA-binding domain-containing protein [Tissierella sp.]